MVMFEMMIFGVEREDSGGNVGNNDDIWVEREDSDGNVGESDVFEVEREDSDGNVGNNDDIWGRKRG